MAPEIVSKKEYQGTAADIWAIGVVMYVILTGYLPFKSEEEKGLYRKI
jgi:5'-AMP-activated protein kinase, catalytic alpha subunit